MAFDLGTSQQGELTLEQKQKQAEQTIDRFVKLSFKNLIQIIKNGRNLVNADGNGLTREQVLAGLPDDKRIALGQYDALLKNLINTVAPNTIDPPEPEPITAPADPEPAGDQPA